MGRRRRGRVPGALALCTLAGAVYLTAGGWRPPAEELKALEREGMRTLLAQELPMPEEEQQALTQEQQERPTPEAPAAQPPTEPEPEREETALNAAAQLMEAPEQEPEAPQEEREQEEIPEIDIESDALELTNSTKGIEVELGDYLEDEPALKLSHEGPQILIMHTHGTEAYTMADGDDYTPSDNARTTDEDYNMIRVGEEMRKVFQDMGLEVVHDTSLYDYPGYNGSYARSLKGIRSYLEEYPTISVVLDVHRDAMIAADGTAIKVCDEVDGENVARVMLVVGTDDGGLEHPRWEDNLTLAAWIQARMLMTDEGFPRPVNLRSQRFNQHMTAGSLLVEVGTSGNTLQEALAGARLFARAAGQEYLSRMEE